MSSSGQFLFGGVNVKDEVYLGLFFCHWGPCEQPVRCLPVFSWEAEDRLSARVDTDFWMCSRFLPPCFLRKRTVLSQQTSWILPKLSTSHSSTITQASAWSLSVRSLGAGCWLCMWNALAILLVLINAFMRRIGTELAVCELRRMMLSCCSSLRCGKLFSYI